MSLIDCPIFVAISIDTKQWMRFRVHPLWSELSKEEGWHVLREKQDWLVGRLENRISLEQCRQIGQQLASLAQVILGQAIKESQISVRTLAEMPKGAVTFSHASSNLEKL